MRGENGMAGLQYTWLLPMCFSFDKVPQDNPANKIKAYLYLLDERKARWISNLLQNHTPQD